jgi:hypothetical protein
VFETMAKKIEQAGTKVPGLREEFELQSSKNSHATVQKNQV